MAKIFLDTNIFLYATGGESAHRSACREVLTLVGDGRLEGVTSAEVLQEILYVRARRLGNRAASESVRAAAALVAEVLSVGAADILEACRLLEKHPKLRGRDAVHAAVMKNASIHLLCSVDPDFDMLKGIRRMSPEDALRFAE